MSQLYDDNCKILQFFHQYIQEIKKNKQVKI
jgi:hypothetical protein